MTLVQVWDLIQSGGVPMTLLIFIWAGLTKRIRYGYQFEDLERERERERVELRQEVMWWRDQFWTQARISDKAVGALPTPGKDT
jgi:hypothetical protein